MRKMTMEQPFNFISLRIEDHAMDNVKGFNQAWMAESGRVAGSAPADPDPESGRVGLSRGSGLCKPVLWKSGLEAAFSQKQHWRRGIKGVVSG
ncbi:hypothetical protein Taro_009808 [Colocasia esculenta]|uniref:Uncharacterized protein n=1 Tax=Colocasia esculenta TaxID=4460 RepID=A0A843U199_COLES|nr:hypothetical protein [Colocasia esculenta]